MEQRAIEELTHEGVSLAALHATLELSRLRSGWVVVVRREQEPAASRAVAELPDDAEPAAAQVATIAATLLGAEPPAELAVHAKPKEDDVGRRIALLDRVARELPPGQRWDGRWLLLPTLALASSMPALMPVLFVQGRREAWGFGIAGAAIGVSGAVLGAVLPAESAWWASGATALAQAGTGISLLAASYSPEDVTVESPTGRPQVVRVGGFRPGLFAAGVTSVAVGVAQVLVTSLAPHCTLAEQNRLADAALAAEGAGRAGALAALEACAERSRRAARLQWWVTGTGLVGLAGTAIASYASGIATPEDFLWKSMPMLFVALTLTMSASANMGSTGIAPQFAERLRDAGLGLDAAVLPGGGAVVGVHGRF